MTNLTTFLAESQPLDGEINPLLPKNYDIVWSLVCLIVILFFFWKLVLPKFNAVLDERTERIEGGLEEAEAIQAEAKAALAQYNEQLVQARAEAQRIREDAREQGQQIIDQMKSAAQQESDRILENGKQQLQAQRQQLVADLRSEVGRTAVDLAEKLLKQQLSDDTRRSDTIDRFLTELDGVDVAARK